MRTSTFSSRGQRFESFTGYMNFKTLKHKKLPDTFGIIQDGYSTLEIYECEIPFLYPMTATIESLIDYYISRMEFNLVDHYFPEYELVEVEVILK